MKTLKVGQEKIQEICDVLRRETLEPAQTEAQKIIRDAEKRAEQMIKEAEKQGQQHLEQTRIAIAQERNVFETSLSQAAVQGLESLRQTIEHTLFNEEMQRIVDQQMANPQVIAKLINAIVASIEKEGVTTNISALIPHTVSPEEVNRLLLEGILDKLREKTVAVGDFTGGAKVKLHDKKMTIDISDEALVELLTQYVRKDFRKIIFDAAR